MRLPAKRRDRLQLAIVINQLATPGMGSWIADHRIAGAGQLAVSLSGFFYFLFHCFRHVVDSTKAAIDGMEAPAFPIQSWELGFLLIGIAWLWAGVTSFQIFLELRRERDPALPPRLDP